MNSKTVLVSAGCAAAGIAIGFIGGFIFGKAKYKKIYEKELEKELLKSKKSDIPEGEAVSSEKAEEIGKGMSAKELWTEAFKEKAEKREEYKNLVRKEGYFEDEDGNEVDSSEVFNVDKFDEENKKRCKEDFEEQLELFSEYSGISKEELMKGSVRIITDEEYYETTHENEPTELQWSPSEGVLRSIDGDILEPEITFGEDWDEILRRIEARAESETWVYDERLEEYYCVELDNPRNIK